MLDLRSHREVTPASAGDAASAGDGPASARDDKAQAETAVAAEVSRLDATLRRLRERIADLHALQLDQEESGAVLANRVGALECAAPPPPAATGDVAALMQRVEDIAGTQPALADETASLAQGLGEVRDALAVLRRRLEAVAGRVDSVAALERRLESIGGQLNARIDGLEQDIEDGRARAVQLHSAHSLAVEARLRRQTWRLGVPLVLVGLGALALSAGAWWSGHQRSDQNDRRLAQLAAQLETDREAGASRFAGAIAGLTDRVAGLEQQGVQLAQGLQQGLDAAGGSPTGQLMGAGAMPDAAQQAPASALTALAGPAGVPGSLGTSAGPQSANRARQPLRLAAPRWMIQLIGFFEADQARAFTAANGIAESAWLRMSRYRGRNWHTVLTGDFPDRASALAAIDSLPAALGELRPIARLLPAGTRLEPAN